VQHHWDFSDCPKDERAICYRYEYCRESNIGEAVRTFRQREPDFESLYDECMRTLHKRGFPDNLTQESKGLWKIAMDALLFRLTLNYDFFSCIPDFPDCPWLDLSEEMRSSYFDKIASFRTQDGPPHSVRAISGKELENLNWPVWNEAQKSIRPDSLKVLLEIPAGLSREEVRNQLDNLLKQISEQNDGLFSTSAGGRGGPLDKLRQLSAFRLLRGRSPTEAFRFVSRHTNQKAELLHIYDSVSQGNAWYRARDDAKTELEKFNDVAEKLITVLKS